MTKPPGPQARIAAALEQLVVILQTPQIPAVYPSTATPVAVPALHGVTPRMIGQPETISPDGVALPGIFPGARTAGGVPLVNALRQAAASAAGDAAREAVQAAPPPAQIAARESERFVDAQVHKVAKQGRGDETPKF